MAKKRRSRRNIVPVDQAMRDASLIAPIIREAQEETDPETQCEQETIVEEGLLRHGFRALIPYLE